MNELGTSVVVALAFAYSLAKAADEKPVTLTGDLMCAKCALKEGTACSDVLIVKAGDKETRYSVTVPNKSDHVCSGKKHVQITGTVSEKDGVKTIAATKVEEVKA